MIYIYIYIYFKYHLFIIEYITKKHYQNLFLVYFQTLWDLLKNWYFYQMPKHLEYTLKAIGFTWNIGKER